MRNPGKMNKVLRLFAFIGGITVLVFSIYWSQDGFNFDIAGDAGYGTAALIGGYALAIVVSVVQFVFSTNFRNLNPSLVLFGILAYVYSIYTNKLGVTHFQGASPNEFGAWFLGFCVDGLPEPLIAWSLGESLTGDFVGNIWQAMKGLGSTVLDAFDTSNQTNNSNSQSNNRPAQHQNQPRGQYQFGTPSSNQETRPNLQAQRGQGRKAREEERSKKHGEVPNPFERFGE